MNCRSAEALYSAFIEDELNQEERRSLEAHLMGCRRCSVAVKDLKETLALVSALPMVETSPHFEDEIFDRIRSGEALRPTMVEWLGGFFTADRLRPVFLGGAAVCALWIGVIVMHPDAYFPKSGTVANRETGAANTNPTDTGSLASSGGASATPGTESAPAAPAFGPRSALASSEKTAAPPSKRVSTKPGEEFQWADSHVPVASGGSDSAVADPGFQDEYILDQFHLDRGDRGTQSIVPVTGNASDDVYITF
jgi:anti-sigma factor RsiW